MTILRGGKDSRSPAQRKADKEMLARFERGDALVVTPSAMAAAERRIRDRNAQRRREVARLGAAIAELRRTFGLTQDEVARAIGTSKPNISALERGRAPGISLERFIAVLETIRARAGSSGLAGSVDSTAATEFSPTAGIRSLAECLEAS